MGGEVSIMLQQAHSELDRLKARLSRSSQDIVSIVVLAIG